jgi:hypothetical protein
MKALAISMVAGAALCSLIAVQPHIRAGIGNANEQSRRRSERPRARPKRAVSPPPLPVPIGAKQLLRLWSSIAPLGPEIRG